MSPVKSQPWRMVRGRLAGLLPVAEHDVGAAHANFTDCARRQDFAGIVLHGNFHAGNRHADRAGFPRAANGIKRNHRAGFAQAITFQQREMGSAR